MISNLDEKTSLEFLKQNKFGRLGCILDTGKPYVIPVNYLIDNEHIYIHSLPGQKISAMRSDPNICLQIDRIDEDGFEWQSVIVFGTFIEINNREEKTRILFKFYEEFPRFTPVEAKFDEENSMKKVIIFRIKLDSITGVSENY